MDGGVSFLAGGGVKRGMKAFYLGKQEQQAWNFSAEKGKHDTSNKYAYSYNALQRGIYTIHY